MQIVYICFQKFYNNQLYFLTGIKNGAPQKGEALINRRPSLIRATPFQNVKAFLFPETP